MYGASVLGGALLEDVRHDLRHPPLRWFARGGHPDPRRSRSDNLEARLWHLGRPHAEPVAGSEVDREHRRQCHMAMHACSIIHGQFASTSIMTPTHKCFAHTSRASRSADVDHTHVRTTRVTMHDERMLPIANQVDMAGVAKLMTCSKVVIVCMQRRLLVARLRVASSPMSDARNSSLLLSDHGPFSIASRNHACTKIVEPQRRSTYASTCRFYAMRSTNGTDSVCVTGCSMTCDRCQI